MSTDLEPSLGPYRVSRRLGSGGMGEVFLAYDPRLDRQVAIKRIRPDAGLDDERRSRFQREARVAAGLLHPAIVQVFDLLTLEDVDHIVMEYVPGTSLRRALDDGPLPLPEGLRIARAVAGGLAYAHQQGVIHRDLKTENVLINPEGDAKIADFGVARRLLPSGESSGETLTREGAVMGTYRAMSPEQACGDALDARSDLFSLGILLYELFTGESPFLAGNNARTVERIFNYRPPPLRERAAGVPPSLSDLVEHLLEKEPDLRPRDAEEVVERLDAIDESMRLETEATATFSPAAPPERRPAAELPTDADTDAYLPAARQEASGSGTHGATRRRWWIAAAIVAVVAVAGALVYQLWPSPEPRYVAVLEPEVRSVPKHEEAFVAFGIRNAVQRALTGIEQIIPKSFSDIDEVSGTPREIATAVGADEVVAALITCRGRDCDVGLSRIRAEDGAVIEHREVPISMDDAATTAQAASIGVRGLFPGFRSRAGMGRFEISPADYATYLEIKRDLDAGKITSPTPDLLARLETLRRGSASFADTYLLEAEIAARSFNATREPTMLDRALDLLNTAQELAPGDPDVLFKRAYVETSVGRLDQAEAALLMLEQLVPADVRIIDRRASILSRRGELVHALKLYEIAADRRPSWKRLFNYALCARRLGEIESARSALEELLDRSPGNSRGLSLLADVEVTAGDPARAVDLYRELGEPTLRRLSNLGTAYMLLGDYAAAAEALEQALARGPDNPFIVLNLADIRTLQGQTSEAERLYRRVLALIDEDPAATSAQYLTTRAQALAQLREKREAVKAVEAALRREPEEGGVAFEAAIVFAIVGDYTTAMVHAEEAIDLGYRNHNWFRLPWFDALRSDPEFKKIVSKASAS